MQHYVPIAGLNCTLKRGELFHRYVLNREYILSLENSVLLANFYQEAGLNSDTLPTATLPDNILTGWESPTCQLRGHFLGHLLSACALAYYNMNDWELRGKGEQLVIELRRCQIEHGDGWVFSIPQQYLNWVARGKGVWAPQYTMHKTLMGLVDMVRYAHSELALTVLKDAADWIDRWSAQFTREQFDDILDVETGGMMEVFADLYELTGEERYKCLMERYYRRRLFEPLLQGRDVLSNMHANTTIPETHGCMRAYEVTGERRYLDAVKAYWDFAVTKRGYFVTGGQTCYEVWTGPGRFKDRLNEDNQEHCTVYNMIRLAEFMFRHTGELTYQDYIERNFRNGILAQQHEETGMIAYYLPMHTGSKMLWGTQRSNFWCCHGTLVQVHMRHNEGVCYATDDGFSIMQYRPVRVNAQRNGQTVGIEISELVDFPESSYRPDAQNMANFLDAYPGRRYKISMEAHEQEFELELRIPWWVQGEAEICEDGICIGTYQPASAARIRRKWNSCELELRLPTQIIACSLPDDPTMVAFMDGADVLAGLTDNAVLENCSSPDQAARMIEPENRINRMQVHRFFHTTGQRSIRLIPLSDIRDEQFTLYFRLQ